VRDRRVFDDRIGFIAGAPAAYMPFNETMTL
jgi:hypothetical protein